MKLDLENKVVLITGGTGGIGRQIVSDFLEEGALVVCLIRSEKRMKELENWLTKKKVSVEKLSAVTCDLLDYDAVQKTVLLLAKQFDRIDVLVNCAGSAEEVPVGLLAADQIDQMLDVNLKGPIYLCKAVLKPMFRQKKGTIVNISSITAVKKGRGVAVYAAAKAGIDTFTRILASEVGRKNIRVNSIRPGLILTDMSNPLADRLEEYDVLQTSMERHGMPEEVSKTVLFLASDSSSFTSGECINIDGGII